MVIGSVAFAILRGARLGFLLLVSTLVIGIAYLGMASRPDPVGRLRDGGAGRAQATASSGSR